MAKVKRRANIFRVVLYRLLPLPLYLKVLSKLYFISFNLGLLRKDRVYAFPYFLKHVIRKGDTCIDIGANIGYFAVLLSKLAGKSGQVHAVEPVKMMLKLLKWNTRSKKNVQIYPYALGLENKEIQLGNDSPKNRGFFASGQNFILDEITQHTNAEIEFNAEMKRGSELFASLEKVDFIKCDIEGYEAVVIKEMLPIINKHKPIVLIETVGNERKELINFFKEIDYKMYSLKENDLYTPDVNEKWDILFLPPERLSRIKDFLPKN